MGESEGAAVVDASDREFVVGSEEGKVGEAEEMASEGDDVICCAGVDGVCDEGRGASPSTGTSAEAGSLWKADAAVSTACCLTCIGHEWSDTIWK